MYTPLPRFWISKLCQFNPRFLPMMEKQNGGAPYLYLFLSMRKRHRESAYRSTHVGLDIGERLRNGYVEHSVGTTALRIHVGGCNRPGFVAFGHQCLDVLWNEKIRQTGGNIKNFVVTDFKRREREGWRLTFGGIKQNGPLVVISPSFSRGAGHHLFQAQWYPIKGVKPLVANLCDSFHIYLTFLFIY